MGKSELQAKFWFENLKGRGHVEEVGIAWRILFNTPWENRVLDGTSFDKIQRWTSVDTIMSPRAFKSKTYSDRLRNSQLFEADSVP
jgi:hypothetical protein